jgi:hypothetical protein
MVKQTLFRPAAIAVAAGTVPAAALAVILLLTAFNGLSRRSEVFYARPGTGTTESLMNAIADGNLADAHAAIVSGADPNEAVAFSDVHVTRNLTQFLRPLVLAAARGDDNMVSMLIAAGADARPALGPDGLCAASESAMETAAAVLARHHLRLGASEACAGSVPGGEAAPANSLVRVRQLRNGG